VWTSQSHTHAYSDYGVIRVASTGVDLKDEIFERIRRANGQFLGAETAVVSFPSDVGGEYADKTLVQAYRNGPDVPKAKAPGKWFQIIHVYASVPQPDLNSYVRKDRELKPVNVCTTS
jgi:hypothetical protein